MLHCIKLWAKVRPSFTYVTSLQLRTTTENMVYYIDHYGV